MTQTAGPDPRDVEQVTALLALMRDFPSDEQRARYLLTSNWLRERGAAAAALSAAQLEALRRPIVRDDRGQVADLGGYEPLNP
jgi:hypothetical protein